MKTPEEIAAIAGDLESDRVERTTSTDRTDKFAQAICAFANDLPNHRQPGYLLIGVDDKGKPSGLKVTDELLRNLGALRANGNIQPLPAMTVSRVVLPEGEVAVVEVQPADLPPVRYHGQVWIRVGPRRGVASEQEERMLSEKRVAHALSFDASPAMGSAVSDLSVLLFSSYRGSVVSEDVIAANHRSIEEQLSSLRFFDLRNKVPTVSGILLFGKNPRYFFPCAYVQFLKLPGNTLTELPDDQAEVSGDLLSVLRELDARVRANLHTTIQSVSALRESVAADYPEVAIRELLLNAIMHRDYQAGSPVRFYWFADHIEIQSPGGLYGTVTKETLTTRNSYRNPVIAEAMKALGYVNRFGYGIQRAQAALAANGNPPAEFEIDDRVFLAIIRRRKEDPQS